MKGLWESEVKTVCVSSQDACIVTLLQFTLISIVAHGSKNRIIIQAGTFTRPFT